MEPIALVICLLIIGYVILAAIGVFRMRIGIALKWIGISIISAFITYVLFYTLQNLLPRLYELTLQSCIVVATASLAVGYYKVFGTASK